MAAEFGLILQLVTQLLPHLLPDEISKLKSELEKIEKEWKEDEQTLAKALQEGNISALNKLLAKYMRASS